ncbi:MAG: L,D-transpeptidase family protein [Tateyamaria sp.]|nr:L,D-transpeptidase family protein [Tateyamaria sp.]MBT5302060.1 L,D-transpeptidase family protein [Tateyamaria sp.]
MAEQGNPSDIAQYEVLASDAAARLIKYSYFGKVDPAGLDQAWNFERPIIKSNPVQLLSKYLDGEGFSTLMRQIEIKNKQYKQLIDALARYKIIAQNGGWLKIPDHEVIKPGMISPTVSRLRDRLDAEGSLYLAKTLPKAPNNSIEPRQIYDIDLQNDIRAFQARHGLEADGVIGKRSFQALNRTAEHRVDQLKLSLERGRWLMRDLNEDFILVNIAGARAYLVRADGTLWTTRSITGSQYRKTPVFRDKIKYMEFNPTWTVPRSIFLKDKLAKIRQDPAYLERNNYVVKQSNGDLISPKLVNWSSPNPNVTLMQKPGPNNALGLVKFMFPNQYAVYLHDTNDKSLFNRNQRNLSSGCVRLEYPFELAMLLMEDDPDWSFKRMQAILDSKKTTRINLLKPIPVLLTYWTSWVEENQVHFREDIYDRDTNILNALKNN